mgnify:CR=1 FL=1
MDVFTFESGTRKCVSAQKQGTSLAAVCRTCVIDYSAQKYQLLLKVSRSHTGGVKRTKAPPFTPSHTQP